MHNTREAETKCMGDIREIFYGSLFLCAPKSGRTGSEEVLVQLALPCRHLRQRPAPLRSTSSYGVVRCNSGSRMLFIILMYGQISNPAYSRHLIVMRPSTTYFGNGSTRRFRSARITGTTTTLLNAPTLYAAAQYFKKTRITFKHN